MFSAKFFALAAFVSATLALPSVVPTLRSIPSNAVRMAHDVERDVIIAFDIRGEPLGTIDAKRAFPAKKRDVGTCTDLSSDDVQKLNGWSQISQYASDNWGGDWDSVNTNPSDYPDSGAQLCVTGDTSIVTIDATPTCSNQTQTSGGTLVGSGGTVTLSANQGTQESTTVTVTSQSALSVGETVSVKIGFPDIAEVTASETVSLTLTNTLSTATTSQTSNQQTQTIAISATAGQTCQLTFTVENCDFTGTGQIVEEATGWVWFYYGSQRDGHFHWAVQIEAIVTNEPDRQTTISYSTSTSSSTNAEYESVCQ